MTNYQFFNVEKYEDKIALSVTGWSKVLFTGCYHQISTKIEHIHDKSSMHNKIGLIRHC